jgi:hypothetical protein
MQLEIISRKPAFSARPTPLLFDHGTYRVGFEVLTFEVTLKREPYAA